MHGRKLAMSTSQDYSKRLCFLIHVLIKIYIVRAWDVFEVQNCFQSDRSERFLAERALLNNDYFSSGQAKFSGRRRRSSLQSS